MKFFTQLNLFTLIVGVGFNISGCGQKGPLVVPAKPTGISTPYPVAATAENRPTDHPDLAIQLITINP